MMTVRAQAFVLAAVAGCACSATLAGDPLPFPNSVNSQLRFAGRVGPSGGPDVVQHIYNNGDTNATTGYFSSANTTKVLDDVYFNRGPGAGPGPGTAGVARLMTTATVGIASTAFVNPSAPVDVSFQWFNGFNPNAGAGLAVNSLPAGTVRATVQPPPGGWLANTVYLVDLDLSTLPGGGIQTVNEYGAVELALYADQGSTPSTDFNVGFYGDGVTIGDSSQTFWFDNNLNGIYAGDEGFIFGGAERPRAAIVLSLQSDVTSGSCCLPDGSCIIANSASCARVGGVYGGDGTDCATVVCNEPGACLLTAGSCILTNASQCTTLGGVYKGNGSNCAEDVCRAGTGSVTLWNNGPLATGTTVGAATAPAGTQFSSNSGIAACQNTTFGFAGGSNGPFRLADDFEIPSGETWTIQTVETFAYQTNSGTATSPIIATNVAIWNGPPHDPTASIVAGDQFTNIQTSSAFAQLYRTAATAGDTARPIFRQTATFSTPVVLGPGRYWIDWQTTASGTGANFAPPVTTKSFRGTADRNALQSAIVAGLPSWTLVEELGGPGACGEGIVAADFPFVLKGSTSGLHNPNCGASPCYANCDGSTTAPILNVNDFICFQGKYAAGDPSANCDESTTPPVLNVNDFICFQGKYAAGCP